MSLLAATLPANAALELLAAVMPNAAHSATEAPTKDPTFYARWPYATPADIIPYIEAVSVLCCSTPATAPHPLNKLPC